LNLPWKFLDFESNGKVNINFLIIGYLGLGFAVKCGMGGLFDKII
jgi:hypothetical protein